MQFAFVGRRRELDMFEELVRLPQAPDQYRILSIHGVRGQGKTSLLQRMQAILRERDRKNIPVASLDFDLPEQRESATALLDLRNQLRRAGVATNAFEIAFARHFALTRIGHDIRQEHPELFRFEAGVLSELIGLASDVFSSCPAASSSIPCCHA